MQKVYVLEHSAEGLSERIKILGVYSSEEEAKNAIESLKDKSGFKDYPDDFVIDEYELNKICWSDGFG